MLEIIALITVFGLFAIFVKECRMTAFIVALSATINLAFFNTYEDYAARGENIQLLIMSFFEFVFVMMLAAMGDKRQWQQAQIFVYAIIAHAILGMETSVGVYVFYDYYEYSITALNVAHFVMMWGLYGLLFRNIKRSCTYNNFYRVWRSVSTRVISRLPDIK